MQNLSGKMASGVKLILLAPLATLLILALSPAPAAAKIISTFFAVLNGAQENPPTPSAVVGNAVLTFDKKSGMLCYAIGFNTLPSGERTDGPGSAHIHGPAVIGQNASILFSITINIHSVNFGGGEIRGQVLPVDD